MKTKLIIAIAAVAGTLAAEQPLYNIGTPGSSDSEKTPSSSTVTSTAFMGKITSINRDTKTVTFEDKDGKSQTLHVGDTTKLSRGDNTTATWDDLKVGTEIRGMVRSQGGMSHAETLMVGDTGE